MEDSRRRHAGGTTQPYPAVAASIIGQQHPAVHASSFGQQHPAVHAPIFGQQTRHTMANAVSLERSHATSAPLPLISLAVCGYFSAHVMYIAGLLV